MTNSLKNARILIADDEPMNVHLLDAFLRGEGYCNIESTSDSRQIMPLCHSFKPDILLLDLLMPYLDGFAILSELRLAFDPESSFPVLVLTADAASKTKRRALAEGAHDFITKPLDQVEVLLRIRNLLETHFRHLLLEERVQERTRALQAAQLETLQRLALAAEYRDDDTGQHTRRVGRVSAKLAERLGSDGATIELVRAAAPLHDVGKISVPDGILLKPGKLTDEEFDKMKTHTRIGASILSGSTSPWLQMAEEIAFTHHERWDGSGYGKIVGEAIPMPGRIVAVADVFDALTHDRPYKVAWPINRAVDEIQSQVGRHFDPALIDAFLSLDHASLV